MAKDERRRERLILYATRDTISSPPFSEAGALKGAEYLRQLAQGATFAYPLMRPMQTIGRGVAELRFSDGAARRDWRIVYYRDREAVVVLAIFEKSSSKTPRRLLDACGSRLKAYLQSRKE